MASRSPCRPGSTPSSAGGERDAELTPAGRPAKSACMTSKIPAPRPSDPQLAALIERALAERQAGRLDHSARLAEQALAIDRQDDVAWVLLCNALLRLGSLDADRAHEDALAALPADCPAIVTLTVDLSKILAERGRWSEAVARVRQAEAIGGLSPRQHDILGSVLSIVGLYEEALPHAEKAIAQNAALHWYNYATTLRYLGHGAQAEAGFERALALDPAMTLAFAGLAAARRATPEQNPISAVQALLAKLDPSSLDAARLHHVLFKAFDDLKQPDQAWAHLEQGGQKMSAIYRFDAQERAERVEQLIAHYPRARFQSPAGPHPAGPRPIFVFGLPRSGTTITERVLASHSQVRALGETPALLVAMKKAAGLARADLFEAQHVAATAAADFAEVARIYQACLAFKAEGAAMITDKLPQNYEHVGAMRLAFPNASLVHVRRAPMDSLFGAHKLLFGEGGYHWSYRLEDLACAYRCYRKIMAHWRASLGEAIFTITLEQLIAEPEAQIRALLAHCGLPFEEACLSPHEAKGGVSTASASQVRKPLNADGVGAWRRYARQLEPLRAMLEDDGFVDADGEPIWD